MRRQMATEQSLLSDQEEEDIVVNAVYIIVNKNKFFIAGSFVFVCHNSTAITTTHECPDVQY